MMSPETITLLNRLLGVIGKSFVQYLRYSRPYIPPGRDSVMETFESIVTDQDALVDRISQMLVDAQAPVRAGEFPMEYTDVHDLGIDFLVNAAVEYQRQDIGAIESLVEQLRSAPAAKALAEEALGMAKGHLESLRELLPAATASE